MDEKAEALRLIAEGRADFQTRADLEHGLLVELNAGGADAVGRFLASLSTDGFDFERVDLEHGRSRFECPLPGGDDLLLVEVHRDEDVRSVNVMVESVSPVSPVSPEFDEQDERHVKFYRMWEEMLGLEDAEAARLDGPHRAVYLVAVLESEVMNGGFGQYVSNTDARHVDETLDCLEAIGATSTRRLLGVVAALLAKAGSVDELWELRGEDLGKLDDGFLAAAEDLPSGVIKRFFSDDPG